MYEAPLDHVLGGVGGVRSAGWGVPAHDAGLRLFEAPPGGLLVPVVVSAWRADVAFAGRADWPGDGVVGIGVGRGPVAAGRDALGGPRLDQVLDLAADDVLVGIVPVVAGAFGDRGEFDSQAAQQIGDLGGLFGGW